MSISIFWSHKIVTSVQISGTLNPSDIFERFFYKKLLHLLSSWKHAWTWENTLNMSESTLNFRKFHCISNSFSLLVAFVEGGRENEATSGKMQTKMHNTNVGRFNQYIL